MAGQRITQANLIADINAILHEGVAAGAPGLSAAISSSRGQWTFTAGVSDLQSAQPIENTHLFGVGSITKVFVAVVVLQLIEDKKLQLSDFVGGILDAAVLDGIENAKNATVGHLLSHKAGIDSWEDDPAWIRRGRGSDIDPAHIWAKTEPLDYIRRPKTTAPEPGKFYYANTNYTLLGLIIEKVTRSTAETEIRRRILEPLSMEHTFLEGFEPSDQRRLSCRYHWATDTFRDTAGMSSLFPKIQDNLVDCTSSNLSTEWTAGGIVSSAADLVKFASALRDGKLLNVASMGIMKEWRQVTDSQEMGHGLFRMTREEGSVWLGHNGAVLGFVGALWWSEDGDCAISVLSNVGAIHSGDVPSHAGYVALRTDFLKIAARLAAS